MPNGEGPRVGVVGAGALGFHHARLLREVPGVRFAGFFDADAARAAHVAEELGVARHATYDALLDAADALCVVVPTPAHYAVAREALLRGKHLLVEKPITATLAEADELLALAEGAGVVVQTGHVERFNRAVRAALPYVDEPRFVESDRLAPFSLRGSDVAVVLDLMIHDIDLVRTLVGVRGEGARVQEVRATGVPVITPSVDIASARVAFASGAVANITASRVSRERVRKVRIFQRSGYLSLDLGVGAGEFFRLRDGVDLAALAAGGNGAGRAPNGRAPNGRVPNGAAAAPAGPLDLALFVERVPLEAPEGEPLRLELESFAAAVRGEQPVAVSGSDGREALAVALQIVAEIERTLPALRGGAAR